MFGWVEKDGDLGDSNGPTSPEETVYVGQTVDPNVVINVNPCFRWSDLSNNAFILTFSDFSRDKMEYLRQHLK